MTGRHEDDAGHKQFLKVSDLTTYAASDISESITWEHPVGSAFIPSDTLCTVTTKIQSKPVWNGAGNCAEVRD